MFGMANKLGEKVSYHVSKKIQIKIVTLLLFFLLRNKTPKKHAKPVKAECIEKRRGYLNKDCFRKLRCEQ